MTFDIKAPRCFIPILDSQNYVYIGGVRVARWIPERNTLQFCDGDKRRASRRGPYVEVRLTRLCELAE